MTANEAARPDRPGAPPTTEELRGLIADASGIDPAGIVPGANLVHLGVGSLEMMRLVTRWHRAGVRVEFEDLVAEPTIDGWERILTAAWQPAAGPSGGR